MKKLDRKQYSTALRAAVTYLKGMGKILRESEIAVNLDYSKGLVSSYLSGGQVPSRNFIEAFEAYYKIKLEDLSKIVEIDEPESVSMASLIRIESMVRTNSAYIAELYAKQASVISTKVAQDMERMAAAEALRIVESMKKK